MKKICIYCGNLHSGGGVQVATSFIYELSNLINVNKLNISLIISSEVHNNLSELNCNFNQFEIVSVANIYGLTALMPKSRKPFKDFDVVFTVFGPDYLMLNKKIIKITGFAQPWIVYPNNEVYNNLSYISRIKNKVKFYIQRKFFSYSDQIIVEIGHVKSKLSTMKQFKNKPISVVHNCLASIFLNPDKWNKVHITQNNNFSIGYLGRDYLHKNTKILPLVKKELQTKYKKNISFYVTFNDEEWKLTTSDFKSTIENIGVLNVSQCPSFYEQMDAIIFPSLLECFSATPLESMAMKKPLFASDREFIKDICEDYAFYIDPLQPASIAYTINQYIDNIRDNDSSRLEDAKLHALNFSNPKQRAEKYLELITNY